MTWSTRVVAALCEAKRLGVGFEEAWQMALEAHPPTGRELGPSRRTLFPVSTEEEPHADFLRRVCADAWHGRRPELRPLVSALEHFDAVDETRASSSSVMVGRVGRRIAPLE